MSSLSPEEGLLFANALRSFDKSSLDVAHRVVSRVFSNYKVEPLPPRVEKDGSHVLRFRIAHALSVSPVPEEGVLQFYADESGLKYLAADVNVYHASMPPRFNEKIEDFVSERVPDVFIVCQPPRDSDVWANFGRRRIRMKVLSCSLRAPGDDPLHALSQVHKAIAYIRVGTVVARP